MLCSRVNRLPHHQTPTSSTLPMYLPPRFFPFSIFTSSLSKHPSPRNSFVFKSSRTSLLLTAKQCLSFQAFRDSLQKTPGWGVPSSSHFPSSLFHFPHASALEPTLARPSTSVHCKGLTENPSLLESTLMKKPGGGERYC